MEDRELPLFAAAARLNAGIFLSGEEASVCGFAPHQSTGEQVTRGDRRISVGELANLFPAWRMRLKSIELPLREEWRMKCPHCQSVYTNQRPERTELGYRRFRCRGCQREFNQRTGTPCNRLQYPSDVVCLVVLWRVRHKLSPRDLVAIRKTLPRWVRGQKSPRQPLCVCRPPLAKEAAKAQPSGGFVQYCGTRGLRVIRIGS